MSSYIFKVNNYEEIDLARISRENPEAEVLIVTGIDKRSGCNARLLLNNTFLSLFVTGDNLRVEGELLCCKWGIADKSDGAAGSDRTPFHRWCYLFSDRIPVVIADLRKAKKFLEGREKKHTIKVSELDIDEKHKAKVSNRALTSDEPKLEKPITINYDKDSRILYATNDSGLPINKVIIDGVNYAPDLLIEKVKSSDTDIPF